MLPRLLLRRRLLTRAAVIDADIAYWTQHLEQIGYSQLGPGDFKKGDRVLAHGHPATVVRVNKKSLTVLTDVMPIPNTYTYERIARLTEMVPA